MPNLQIITVPNPLLKEKSEDVKEFNQNLKNTIRNMYDTLYSSGEWNRSCCTTGWYHEKNCGYRY